MRGCVVKLLLGALNRNRKTIADADCCLDNDPKSECRRNVRPDISGRARHSCARHLSAGRGLPALPGRVVVVEAVVSTA